MHKPYYTELFTFYIIQWTALKVKDFFYFVGSHCQRPLHKCITELKQIKPLKPRIKLQSEIILVFIINNYISKI